MEISSAAFSLMAVPVPEPAAIHALGGVLTGCKPQTRRMETAEQDLSGLRTQTMVAPLILSAAGADGAVEHTTGADQSRITGPSSSSTKTRETASTGPISDMWACNIIDPSW